MWYLLRFAISSTNQSDEALLTWLFAAFVAGSQARNPLSPQEYSQLQDFWHSDALVTSLVYLLKRYANKGLAFTDALAIRQWLIDHAPAEPIQMPSQPPAVHELQSAQHESATAVPEQLARVSFMHQHNQVQPVVSLDSTSSC